MCHSWGQDNKQIGKLQALLLNNLCQVPCGAAGIDSLMIMNLTDRMDSFYLRFVAHRQRHWPKHERIKKQTQGAHSETLKYLYLLFDEENEFNKGHVFTTEAHPLPVVSPLYKDLPGTQRSVVDECPVQPRDMGIVYQQLFRRIDKSYRRMRHRLLFTCVTSTTHTGACG